MPECNENTDWYLIKKVFNATIAEIDFFTNLYHNNPDFTGDGNYRELQTGNNTLNINIIEYKRN